MSSIREQLHQLKAKLAEKTPEQFRKITTEEVQKLIDSQAIQGLLVGTAAPDFTLSDEKGNLASLSEKLHLGPVVLSFYRGSW